MRLVPQQKSNFVLISATILMCQITVHMLSIQRNAAANLQQLFMLTQSILYLLRNPVFAAVINNLEVSPSTQSFKSTQLAAWLSPLHSKSIIRASCRLLGTILPSDHTSLFHHQKSAVAAGWTAEVLFKNWGLLYFLLVCLFQINYYRHPSCTFETLLM